MVKINTVQLSSYSNDQSIMKALLTQKHTVLCLKLTKRRKKSTYNIIYININHLVKGVVVNCLLK